MDEVVSDETIVNTLCCLGSPVQTEEPDVLTSRVLMFIATPMLRFSKMLLPENASFDCPTIKLNKYKRIVPQHA